MSQLVRPAWVSMMIRELPLMISCSSTIRLRRLAGKATWFLSPEPPVRESSILPLCARTSPRYPIPVSYTHLDVYKRQRHNHSCTHHPPTVGRPVYEETILKSVYESPWASRIVGCPTTLVSVSYTHLYDEKKNNSDEIDPWMQDFIAKVKEAFHLK